MHWDWSIDLIGVSKVSPSPYAKMVARQKSIQTLEDEFRAPTAIDFCALIVATRSLKNLIAFSCYVLPKPTYENGTPMLRKFAFLLSTIALVLLTAPASANASSHIKSLRNLGANELMFAQMMIPHHRQAVEMSALALRNSSDVTIKALAKKISGAQRKEMVQMGFWLGSKNASMGMNGEMGIEGMLTGSQLKNLGTLKGKKFDKVFLSAMIAHHNGALQMTSLIKGSKNQEARSLAQAIFKVQSKEIAFMQMLLEKLG